MRFVDRTDAGRKLARALEQETFDPAQLVVLGLARGGVEVAAEVARHFDAPLDVLVVRKIGSPYQPELAVGAVAPEGVRVVNDEIVESLKISESRLAQLAERARQELGRKLQTYRGERQPVELSGRDVVLVDDGLATGATMRAAVEYVRNEGVDRLIVAVPVGSHGSCDRIRREVDRLVCLTRPSLFFGVGQAYDSFLPTDDQRVTDLLNEQ